MTFLKAAIKTSKAPQVSLISLMKENLGGYRPARSHKNVHASDLTKPHFCPREYALLDLTGKKLKDEYIPTALESTFDVGSATAELVIHSWLRKHAFGDWKCRVCGQEVKRNFRPAAHHANDLESWRYREVRFHSNELDANGGVDVLVQMGNLTLQVVELKIMAPDQFEKLAAPLAEHRIRTCLYLKMIADSNDPLKKRINQHEGRVLYVSRGHGKMNAEHKEVLPFKEYMVERNDACLDPVIERAKSIKRFRHEQIVPYGVCKSNVDPRLKSCSVAAECMSGKHPPGMKCQ